jgi:hypothetical protein
VLSWHFTSDAARGTRLITISFSEQGKQVNVREPQKVLRTATFNGEKFTVLVNESDRNIEQKQIELSKVKLTRRQQLEREMAGLKSKLEEARNEQETHPDARGELELKLKIFQREFEASGLPEGKVGPIGMAGRQITAISAPDLSDSVRNDLFSRLPIREGDTLSKSVIEETVKAVRAFDEHLRVQFRATANGQLEIRIVVPNERR